MHHINFKTGDEKRIALFTQVNKIPDLIDWAKFNQVLLARHRIFTTEITGYILEKVVGFEVNKLQLGSLSSEQEIESKIAHNEIGLLIAFCDSIESYSNDPDVKKILNIAILRNIPIACNRASADFMISSSSIGYGSKYSLSKYDLNRRWDLAVNI